MKKFFIGLGIVFAVILVLFLSIGGFGFLNYRKHMPAIEKSVAEFYEQYNKQNFAYIYEIIAHEEFRKSISREEFDRLLKVDVWEKLGPVKEYNRGKWKINRTPDGLYFAVQYEAITERYKSNDTFTFKKHNGSWLLIRYNFNYYPL